MNTKNETPKNNFNATIGNTVLCDGFLIPMTDFVNNVGNMENYPSHENALSWIYNYTTFLKQPLKLEMFVPCDDEGNILEEPEDYEQRLPNMMTEYNDEIYRYKQAKEKVLFEGFKIYDYKLNIFFYLGRLKTLSYDKKRKDFITIGLLPETVEDLINISSQIKLSQTALNSIFGETVA